VKYASHTLPIAVFNGGWFCVWRANLPGEHTVDRPKFKSSTAQNTYILFWSSWSRLLKQNQPTKSRHVRKLVSVVSAPGVLQSHVGSVLMQWTRARDEHTFFGCWNLWKVSIDSQYCKVENPLGDVEGRKWHQDPTSPDAVTT
jgi:hypothetical protein